MELYKLTLRHVVVSNDGVEIDVESPYNVTLCIGNLIDSIYYSKRDVVKVLSDKLLTYIHDESKDKK